MRKLLLILLCALICAAPATSTKAGEHLKKAKQVKNSKQAASKLFNPTMGSIVLSDWGGGELYMYVPAYTVSNVVSYSWSISPYTGFEVLSAYPDYQLNVYGLSIYTNYTITITGYDINNNSVSSSVNYYHAGPW